jgi:hypothetical protein
MITGGTDHPAFATNQLRVSLVTIPPGGTVRASSTRGAWMIALDTADAGRALTAPVGAKWVGGTLRVPAGATWNMRNTGRAPVRALAVIRL